MGLTQLDAAVAYASSGRSGSQGSDEGITERLEVVESDFTEMPAEMTATEATAASTYDMETKHDAEYTTNESKLLDAMVVEAHVRRHWAAVIAAAHAETEQALARVGCGACYNSPKRAVQWHAGLVPPARLGERSFFAAMMMWMEFDPS